MTSKQKLQNQSCVPCQGGIPPMSSTEAKAMLVSVPGWELIAAVTKLRCTFTFSNFMQAQSYAVRVGEVSEAENHHPDISYGWGYCTVVFYTHKIGGLHGNDFIMAAKVNAIA
jgi:4a-hydroxytetrahydrobiopterin dehydratase